MMSPSSVRRKMKRKLPSWQLAHYTDLGVWSDLLQQFNLQQVVSLGWLALLCRLSRVFGNFPIAGLHCKEIAQLAELSCLW